jgi:hypothetical protein
MLHAFFKGANRWHRPNVLHGPHEVLSIFDLSFWPMHLVKFVVLKERVCTYGLKKSWCEMVGVMMLYHSMKSKNLGLRDQST